MTGLAPLPAPTPAPAGQVAHWLAGLRPNLTGACTPLDFARSREWQFRDGSLEHVTGRFFAVRGVSVRAPGLPWHGASFPMIDQPEVGLLGFVVAPLGGDWQWLLQGKSEPGTVGWVQVGPTVQATQSNYTRVHGGSATRFLDRFIPPGATAPAGLMQSEQGTRFLSKFNCNALAVADAPFDPGDDAWVWAGSADLRLALAQDFVVNTDARSVIASHMWDRLRPGSDLFTGQTHVPAEMADLRQQCHQSWRSPVDPARIAMLEGRLAHARAGASARIALDPVRLDRLPGWQVTSDAILPDGTAEGLPDTPVFMRRITGPGREVVAWDQPFLGARREARSVLLLVRRRDLLCAVLRVAEEPGFARGPEFGPTWQSDGAGPNWLDDACASADTVLSIRQSDEGGRFLQVIMRYDVRLGDPGSLRRDDPAAAVVTLAELAALCARPGVLTNEARTLVSLILSMA